MAAGLVEGLREPRIARRLVLIGLWIPAAVAVATRLAWQDPPARVPTHWGMDGTANAFTDTGAVWWVTFGVAVISAVIATVSVLGAPGRVPRRAAGVGGLITASAALGWPVFSLAALSGPQARIGPEFWLAVLAPAWAALLYGLALPLVGSEPERRR